MSENASQKSSRSGICEWIDLNVGGAKFTTTRTTLLSQPESMLCRLFEVTNDGQQTWDSARDSNGAYLIDRSPKYFEPVLNFLRYGQLVVDDGVSLQGVLEEAKFFNIAAMVEAIETKMRSPNREISECRPLNRQDVISFLLHSPFTADQQLRFQGFPKLFFRVPYILLIEYLLEVSHVELQDFFEIGVDLSNCDLSRLDLRNANFKYANLSNANLSMANLARANMERCNLGHSTLDGAQLLAVKLTCANLENASLRNCNFEDPHLQPAALEGANLRGANLEGSQMSRVILRVACLKNASVKNCDLQSAVLAGADLENCDFSGSNLQETNLRGANFINTHFDYMMNPVHMSQAMI